MWCGEWISVKFSQTNEAACIVSEDDAPILIGFSNKLGYFQHLNKEGRLSFSSSDFYIWNLAKLEMHYMRILAIV